MARGKYDEECLAVMKATGAETCVVVIIGGDRGNGFSVTSTDPDVESKLPAILRDMAQKLEKIN